MSADQSKRAPHAGPKSRALPVRPPAVRKSRMGRWRAGVLLGVHVLIALHIAHWLRTGSTLTPLEPSEAMEFSKHYVINAGLILFALAILSTLVLGRWFCGWACHLVALQDLSRWVLGRLKIRPRPLRAGLLMVVPLLAFLYMFVGPFVYRLLGESADAHRVTFALIRDDFWATFPPWVPALLTFAVCGFFIIYLLGAKGFCTFGCPYGGIFGVADQIAPLRIRVTDDCRQSGHCTAVCSSNVRVHEEVRDFRMVVDPGCMKCLDCVSVCPTEALFVGLGRPALLAKRAAPDLNRTNGRAARPARKSARRKTSDAAAEARWPRWIVLSAFCFAALAIFTGFDRRFGWTANDLVVSAVLSAVALLVCRLFAGKGPWRNDYSLGEETLLLGFFLLSMAVFRGLYGMVAFLFALGLSAVAAFLLLQFCLLWKRENLTLQRWRLKSQKRLQPAGYAFLLGVGLLLALTADSAMVQYHYYRAQQLRRALRAGATATGVVAALSEEDRRRVEAALAHLSSIDDWALVHSDEPTMHRARLLRHAGRTDEYEALLKEALDRFPETVRFRTELAQFYVQRLEPEKAIPLYREAIRLHNTDPEIPANLGFLLTSLGRLDEAEQVLDSALVLAPDDPRLLQNRGILLAQTGNVAAAAAQFARAVQVAPGFTEARLAYARALGELGRWPEAVAQYRLAAAQQPADAEVAVSLGIACARAGDLTAAERSLRRAVELAPQQPAPRLALSQFLQASGDAAGAAEELRIARELSRPADARSR